MKDRISETTEDTEITEIFNPQILLSCRRCDTGWNVVGGVIGKEQHGLKPILGDVFLF